MLEYSEYKSLIDILERSDRDNVYEDLMKKEEKVLDNVNTIVKNYNDDKHEKKQFIHMSIHELFNRFFTELTVAMAEVHNIKKYEDVMKIITKNNRLVFLGFLMVIIALFLFFIEISK